MWGRNMNRFWIYRVSVLIFLLIAASGCSKKDEIKEIGDAQVQTASPSAVSADPESNDIELHPVKLGEEGKWTGAEKEVVSDGNHNYVVYHSSDRKEIWIVMIDPKTIEDYGEKLVIPEQIDGGIVTKLGDDYYGNEEENDYERDCFYKNIFGYGSEPAHEADAWFPGLERIKSIYLPDTIDTISASCFSGFRGLESFCFPDKVKKVVESVFYGDDKLKEMFLPEKMEEFDVDSVEGCKSLSKISISLKNQYYSVVDDSSLMEKKKKRLVLSASREGKTYHVPKNTDIIGRFSARNLVVKKYAFSDSVIKIEKYGLDGLHADRIASPENNMIGMDGSCLFYRKDGRLIAMISKDGVVKISPNIRRIKGGLSIVNGDVRMLIIPKNVKMMDDTWGTNLHTDIKFMGNNPPRVENKKNGIGLPVTGNIYVKKNAYGRYKRWLKDNNGEEHLEQLCEY